TPLIQLRRLPLSTPSPYTTLSRSRGHADRAPRRAVRTAPGLCLGPPGAPELRGGGWFDGERVDLGGDGHCLADHRSDRAGWRDLHGAPAPRARSLRPIALAWRFDAFRAGLSSRLGTQVFLPRRDRFPHRPANRLQR